MRAAVAGLLALAAIAVAPGAAAAQVPAACPATFTVLHDDRIGPLAVPAGAYRLTVADPARLTCAHAADRFRQFLEDFDGRLPAGWRLDAGTATFTGRDGAAFQIAGVSVPSGGGGGKHPATGTRCPGTFQVLHDDHIGAFAVPSGPYSITLLSVGPLTCAQATRRLARFLQDFDGRLPGRWVLDRRTGTFLRGSARVGFRIEPAAAPAPDGGGTHPDGRRCPGTFRVLHDDRVGALALPRGRYRIVLAPSGRPSCAGSARRLARFLEHPDGRLPGRWRLDAATGTFSRPSGAGFRIKPR